ncbi:MAG TPA: endolytic transglycosylase MltG [Xanthomonadaceae bacterium]|nr:endolytic transglycosylase MltG [Xanthomonadaceae bacterium]
MSRRNQRGRFRIFLALLALFAGFAAYTLWHHYHAFADGPMDGIEPGETLLVHQGDSFAAVLDAIRDAGVRAGHDIEWQLLARQLDAGGRIQVGEYALEPGQSPRELLVAMRDGDVLSYRFTIVEGWNIRQLRAALARKKPLEQEAADLDNDALMEALGHPGQHPEGRFLPETYVYTRGDSDLDVLRRAHAAMDRALAAAWEARVDGLPLESADEALVLASIVEKETGAPEERARIAGVFVRRLEKGMRLQTDPTVIYGIEDYDGNITRAHLEQDTPYNTYVRAGLPPTPIAMPGADALRAATQPADGEALYFVAIGDGSGRHVFSESLAEHRVAVREYLERYRERQRPQP